MRETYSCDICFGISESLPNLAPIESPPMPRVIGSTTVSHSRLSNHALARLKERRSPRRVRDHEPREHSDNDTGKPLHKEQGSPWRNGPITAEFHNQPCQTASERRGQRGGRNEESCSKCELLPLVE